MSYATQAITIDAVLGAAAGDEWQSSALISNVFVAPNGVSKKEVGTVDPRYCVMKVILDMPVWLPLIDLP